MAIGQETITVKAVRQMMTASHVTVQTESVLHKMIQDWVVSIVTTMLIVLPKLVTVPMVQIGLASVKQIDPSHLPLAHASLNRKGRVSYENISTN